MSTLLFPEDNLAALCIFAEARGEPFEGMVAVGEVIRNRAKTKFQSDGTIPGTILWPYAFSWLNTTDRQRTRCFKVEVDDPKLVECYQAWETAKAGSDLTKGADSYYNPSLASPKWAATSTKTVTIGRHDFLIVARR